MKKFELLANTLKAIEELNAPTIIDGEEYESQFEFVIDIRDGRLFIYDKNENYHIDYLEEQNCLMYDCAMEFGFKFEAETIDKVHKKLEDAIQKDGYSFLEWWDSVAMLICE